MIIAVTGAAGFIGSHLSEALLTQGHTVVGIDNFDPFYSPERKKHNLSVLTPSPRFKLYNTDVRKQKALNDIFKKHTIEFVYHLAGRGGVSPSVAKPFYYLDEIVKGTLSLYEACRKNSVASVVNASSSSVYGISADYPYSENAPTDSPTAHYPAYKKMTELLGHTYHHLYGMTAINVRFFSVYGPRGRPDQIIYKFTGMILNGKTIPWITPEPVRDFTYVSDIVDGLMCMLTLPKHTYDIFNLAYGAPHKLSEVITILESLSGKKARIQTTSHAPPNSDFPKTYADISHAQKVLGWKPKVNLNEGIALFFNWYKMNILPS